MTRCKGKSFNLFGYGTNNLDSFAACQYYGPEVLANLGVTCFDIRVYDKEKDEKEKDKKRWRGIHRGITSELGAIKEVADLIKHINKNKQRFIL